MLCSQSKFNLKKTITNNAKTLNSFFSDTDNEDPVGSTELQDKSPYRSDLTLVQNVDFEQKNHHFTEN